MMRELEFAVWYDANKHLTPVETVRDSFSEIIDYFCETMGLSRGSIDFDILKPGDDRVPEVPRWLEQVHKVVPRLLVVTASVSPRVVESQGDMTTELDTTDLTILRGITRRQHRKANPEAGPLTDQQCDKIIDELGMDVVLSQLRSNTVH